MAKDFVHLHMHTEYSLLDGAARIKKLVNKTVRGKMWVGPVKTDYDRTDLFLSPVKMSGKRVCEYIQNQEILIAEEACFAGLMRFDGSVEGDIFNTCAILNKVSSDTPRTVPVPST